MIQLRAHDVGKRFRNRTLFRGIEFVADGGECIAITGSNGSGKSTFLKILGGLLRPTTGTVSLELAGEKIAGDRHSLYFGYVAPAVNVYPALTGSENIRFLHAFYQDAKPTEDELLKLVGLVDAADRPVGEYSSGMVQRIKIACALVGHPAVLLLDEPYSNLDSHGVEVVNRVIDEHRARGGISIVATNVEENADRCDRQMNVEDYSSAHVSRAS